MYKLFVQLFIQKLVLKLIIGDINLSDIGIMMSLDTRIVDSDNGNDGDDEDEDEDDQDEDEDGGYTSEEL
jgi:hypothetical protein